MTLYPDNRACRSCGTMGCDRNSCPVCPCKYCHSPHHAILECSRARPCDICGQKGHPTDKCRASAPKPNRSPQEDGRYNISIKPPVHNDPEWAEIPERIRNLVDLEEPFIFPPLRETCHTLLQDILDERIPGWNERSYSQDIQTHGGINSVTEDLLRHIRPEILQLQGRSVQAETLEEIRKTQDNDDRWNGDMGYMDFITDERSKSYNRRYVGQTNDPQRTMIRGHCQNLLNKFIDSLPRFIVWIGNGNRTANFIRLWSFPSTVSETNEPQHCNETWRQNQGALLEALFCKAFHTSHGVFARHEEDQLQCPSRYGLNILTPLIRRWSKFDASHEGHIAEMSTTADNQILFWITGIRTQLPALKITEQKKCIQASRGILKCDFSGALEKALNDQDLFQLTKLSLTKASPKSKDEGRGHAKTSYFGTFKAKIALVLDYAAVSPAPNSFDEEKYPKEESATMSLPWSLQGCQFNDRNTLVWTFDFQAFVPLGKRELSSPPNENTQNYHRILLVNSNARVVLLCGTRAADALRFAYNTQQYSLELRGFRYPLYIASDTLSTRIPQRLFIVCPTLPARIWSNAMYDGAKLSEALRFAVNLLDIKGLQPYFLESSSVAGSILSWARERRLGKAAMTLGTMDTNIRLWLARKGVSKERITRIVEISGSLPQGLLMVFFSLVKKPSERNKRPLKRHLSQQENPESPQKRSKKTQDVVLTHEAEDSVVEPPKEVQESKPREQQAPLLEDLSQLSLVGPNDAQDTFSGINLLLGRECPSTEMLEKINSIVSHKRPKSMLKELEDGNVQDVSLKDLVPICAQAISLGFLPN